MQPITALTSIRGVAAWWVVLYHFRPEIVALTGPSPLAFLDQGYLAVDLFFELSGFVIALNYASMFDTITAATVLKFLGLRLGRTYPLHIVILAFYLLNPLAIFLFSSNPVFSPRYDPGYFLLSVVLMQNWGFTTETAWNIPAWSISTEWAAYLLFPLLLRPCAIVTRVPGGAAALAALLLGILAAMASRVGGIGLDIAHFGLARCLLEFSAGICLCHIYTKRRPTYGNAATVLAVALLLVSFQRGLPDYLLCPLAFLLLIYGLSDTTSLASRLLTWAPLEAIGVVSYSTYLVHYLVKDWVRFVFVSPTLPVYLPPIVYVAVIAAASAVLYRWVEVPGRAAVRAAVLGRTSPRATATPVRGIS
jgi:peptidoglycan/LPS O-acetylase OafA/YrhL